MKKIILSIVLLHVMVLIPAMAQQVFKTTNATTIGFLEYTPDDYSLNSNSYPVVIFLHGLGERGPNSTDPAILSGGIGPVTRNGPPKHVKNGADFPFILISPQLKNNYTDWPVWYVLEVIDYVKTYLRIDEKRIYLTGLSLGGGGTWSTAQDYPKLFAAVAPICGSRNNQLKACNIASENLPVWAFHGDADGTISVYKSINMVNAINKCSPVPSPKALMTVYPGVNHNSWDRAYTMDHTYHTPNLYEWMLSYSNTVNGGNRLPVANAGTDKTISGNSLMLSGTGSDMDGTIASYSWTKLSGPAVTMSNASTANLTLTGMASGQFVFRLTVKDNGGEAHSDYVRVTVTPGVPVANAGADQVITLPTNSISTSGTGTDTNGTITAYLWKQVSGPKTATLINTTTTRATVSQMTMAGDYIFQLTVTDNDGLTATDQVMVTVKPDPATTTTVANQLPVAYAGKDLVINLPMVSATVTGTGTDPDGSIASYIWTQLSGPVKTTMTGTTTSKLSVSGLSVAGFYVFQLTVKDNNGATATDKMAITVKSAVTASSLEPEQVVEEVSAEELKDPRLWEGKLVRIFSETGSVLYQGIWASDSYENVFASNGLYLYNVVMDAGRKVSGKIMIMQ